MSNPFITEILEQPNDPLGGASGRKRVFSVEFIGKTNNDDFPFTVANEVVAAQLGITLGLNIPSVLTHPLESETVALIQRIDRDPSMQAGPQATSKRLAEYVAANSSEIHGAIVFDLFVANNDRAFGPERRNLMLDKRGKLLLYDFGNACFYRNRPSRGIVAGTPRLDAIEHDFSALFDMDHKENHYREFLSDWKLVDYWCDRIRTLPDFVIESAIERIPADLSRPTPEERKRLIEFLCRRKLSLKQQIERHPDCFMGLPKRMENQS